ncbi:MAG: hypothetical protein AABX73_00780 [Nanoarchaeota archaeon]
MKKISKDLKKGDIIILSGREFIIENIEFSEIGKQGTRKCRIEAKTKEGEKIVIIRPEDYPFDSK